MSERDPDRNPLLEIPVAETPEIVVDLAGTVEAAVDARIVEKAAELKEGLGRWGDVVTEAVDTVTSIDLKGMGFFDALRLNGQADQISSVEQVFDLRLALATNADLAALRVELGEKRALLENADADTQNRFVELFKTSLKVFLEIVL